MITLSWWEQFILGAAVSFLSLIAQKIKNPTELAALQSALAFLQKLLAGDVAHTTGG
jgi:type IV secretory pathway VirB2 component (pilin)